jgi:uncharacterized protein YkwD
MKNIITILFLVFNTFSYTQVVVNLDSVKIYLIEMINAERVRKGAGVLSYDNNLEISAQKHTEYMFIENILSHYEHNKENPYYTALDPWDRGCVSENCLKGTIKFFNNKYVATTMFNTWCKSPGHYKNMINKKHSSMGIGLKNTDPSPKLQLFTMCSTVTFN